MHIRKASVRDAKAIAKFHVDTWRTAYEGIIPTSFLENLSYQTRMESWEMTLNKVDNYVLVAVDDDSKVIGFADTSKRPTNLETNSTDLTSLYLLQEYQGRGIGKLLMQELFRYYNEQNYDSVYVEVLKDNPTKTFYEAFGAKHVEDIEIKIGGKLLIESIYKWDLKSMGNINFKGDHLCLNT